MVTSRLGENLRFRVRLCVVHDELPLKPPFFGQARQQVQRQQAWQHRRYRHPTRTCCVLLCVHWDTPLSRCQQSTRGCGRGGAESDNGGSITRLPHAGCRAFGTRRGAAVLGWCTATRRRSMPPAEHIEEGAAFSPARRTPAHRPNHTRARSGRWGGGGGVGPRAGARTCGHGTRGDGVPARRGREGIISGRFRETSPRAPLLYRW